VLALLFSVETLAKDITIGVNVNLPPYVIDKTKGIELDLLKAVFATQQLDVKFKFFRNTQLIKALKKDDIEAVLINGSVKLGDNDMTVYQSDALLAFLNSAIAFKASNFKMESLKDLARKRIVSFNGATEILGTDYSDAVKTAAAYVEHTNQSMQVKLFLGERYNVVISDQRIFNYWFKRAPLTKHKTANDSKSIEYFPVFAAEPRNNFKDDKLRKLFNKGLKLIKANGVYSEIMERY